MVDAAKVALRDRVRTARAQRAAIEQARLASALAVIALAAAPVREACLTGRWITAYAAMPGEPGTGPLLERVRLAGGRVALPIVRPDCTLAWGEDTGPEHLRLSARGIAEPATADVAMDAAGLAMHAPAVLLIPATAAGRDGSRLGQGGGFYDLLLAAIPARTAGGPWRIAVVHDDEVLPSVPHDDRDQSIDAIMTPTQFLIVG
jgi:5-formyltetrahydrofolate cyclo-ligase